MARLRRICPTDLPAHIIQRGNNRSQCFCDERDKAIYFNYICKASDKYGVRVHAWVFMSNHVHLLLTPSMPEAVSRFMQYLGGLYVRYFNRKYSRTGTLWEGRFRSCLVQTEKYFLTCQRYIELNPVRARIVSDPADFHWSSYHANALGIESSLRTPHPVYLALGNSESTRISAYRDLFSEIISEHEIDLIRRSTNKGLILGTEEFTASIEAGSGYRGHHLKRGRNAANGA
jgi:putative transposase